MPDTHAPQLEPWQWPDAHWRKLVDAGARRPAATGPRPGRTARAAPWRSPSTPTTRPTSCATAASRSAAWPGANTATGSACRASASCWRSTTSRRRSTCRRSPRCCIPTSSARWSPRATRSASTAGSTSSTRCCRYEAERDLMLRSADTLEKITGKRAGRHAHAVLGLQPQHAGASRRRWACSTTPR